jgi:hypothetical protein
MKIVSRLLARWRGKRSVSIPAAIRKLNSYTASTTVEEMQADYIACCDLRPFIRQNFSEQEYTRYLHLLDDFDGLIREKLKLAQCQAGAQAALAALEAKQQQNVFVN